jgi:hypothetical protein
MTTANSPAYAQGRAHKQAHNEALANCPPYWTEPDPSEWNGYTVMYFKGWYSIPEGVPHSCPLCNPREQPQRQEDE